MAETNKKTLWLEKRLAELGKKNYQLADALGIQHNKISQIKAGQYNFQPEHLSSVAEFLKFDKAAFIDFVAGKITEEQLWAAKPPMKITEQDLQLLQAVKSLATTKAETNAPADPAKQTQLSSGKEQER